MVSQDVASEYLEKILKMPPTWGTLLQDRPLDFLRLFQRQHAVLVPFQNITMVGIKPEVRKMPSEGEIIEVGLAGKGGCCFHLNYFAKFIFQAIGLNSWVIQGTHFGSPVPGTHCMVIVKLEEPSGRFLVEVGGAYPILEPIPMDSEKLPFRILCAGGFPYEFREVSPGIVGKYHIGGGLLGGAYIGKEEALRTSWALVPRTHSDFTYSMSEVFTNPANSQLLRNPMIYRFFSNEEVSKHSPDIARKDAHQESKNVDEDAPSHFIFIYKRYLVVGDAFTRKIVKEYKSYDDMSHEIHSYFPMFEKEDIDTAVGVFNRYEVVKGVHDLIL